MGKKFWLIIAVIVSILGSGIFVIFYKLGRQGGDNSKASSAASSVTSQAQWQAGTDDGAIDYLTTPGSIKLDTDETQLTGGVYSVDDPGQGDPANVHDGNLATGVMIFGDGADPTNTVQYNHGSNKYISKVRYYGDICGGAQVWNGGAWIDMADSCGGGSPDWHEESIATGLQYSKARITNLGMGAVNIYEMQIYEKPREAIHYTAPTQIDGGANFWSWDSFTPTQSTPANTSITYRYRTSSDGATWTGWVSAIGSVTSRTGDDNNNPTKYRYLQVEATLSNTDGVSTPTIDQYDIGYHTEVKPNQPSAQTAVVQ